MDVVRSIRTNGSRHQWNIRYTEKSTAVTGYELTRSAPGYKGKWRWTTAVHKFVSRDEWSDRRFEHCTRRCRLRSRCVPMAKVRVEAFSAPTIDNTINRAPTSNCEWWLLDGEQSTNPRQFNSVRFYCFVLLETFHVVWAIITVPSGIPNHCITMSMSGKLFTNLL